MLEIVNGFNNITTCIKNLFYLKKFFEKYKYGKDYYFEEYDKHITIYKNGHGILITSFKLKILNPKKFTSLRRSLSIKDGKKSARFEALEKMLKTDKGERFDSLGFWFNSDDNIITEACEYYYSDTDPAKEDKSLKNDPKILRWRFKINSGKIKKDKSYNIKYAISVPGMFPIEDGKFDTNNNPFDVYDEFSSSLTVTHAMKKIVYTISLEKGIEIADNLECQLLDHEKNGTETKELVEGKMLDELFYDKYIYTIENPNINSSIEIKWNIRHKEATNTKNPEFLKNEKNVAIC